jgi:glutamine amidotransferase-like uncharacterized protein
MRLHRIRSKFVGAAIFVACAGGMLLVCSASVAEEATRRQPIRVVIYAGEGVTRGGLAEVKACLPASKGFDVETITAKEIRDGRLETYAVVIHPGGSGSGQAKALGEEGREKVRQFVEGGGGFIGICAGAYLASAEYPWALKLLDARVLDDEHWARGVGPAKLRLPAKAREALGAKSEMLTIHYENGPLLGPAEREDVPDFESLATFETEIRKNDAPKGVMLGTTAIARGEFGKGRVVCFSPHPEKSNGCEQFVMEAVKWAARDSSTNDEPIIKLNADSQATKPQRGDSQ